MNNNNLFNDLYKFFINVNKKRTDIMKKENPLQIYEYFDKDEKKENIIRKGMCQYEDLIKQFKRKHRGDHSKLSEYIFSNNSSKEKINEINNNKNDEEKENVDENNEIKEKELEEEVEEIEVIEEIEEEIEENETDDKNEIEKEKENNEEEEDSKIENEEKEENGNNDIKDNINEKK